MRNSEDVKVFLQGKSSRLPTIGELRGLMREGKSHIDPNVKREIQIAAMVKDARARGYTEEQIQTLIDNGTTSLPPPKKKVDSSSLRFC